MALKSHGIEGPPRIASKARGAARCGRAQRSGFAARLAALRQKVVVSVASPGAGGSPMADGQTPNRLATGRRSHAEEPTTKGRGERSEDDAGAQRFGPRVIEPFLSHPPIAWDPAVVSAPAPAPGHHADAVREMVANMPEHVHVGFSERDRAMRIAFDAGRLEGVSWRLAAASSRLTLEIDTGGNPRARAHAERVLERLRTRGVFVEDVELG